MDKISPKIAKNQLYKIIAHAKNNNYQAIFISPKNNLVNFYDSREDLVDELNIPQATTETLADLLNNLYKGADSQGLLGDFASSGRLYIKKIGSRNNPDWRLEIATGTARPKALRDLRLAPEALNLIYGTLLKGSGMIFITGENNHLAHFIGLGILDCFNHDQYNLIAAGPDLEDIPKNISFINTNQLNPDAYDSFIHKIKRYDPDAVYLGTGKLPNNLKSLARLADRKLIIIYLSSPDSKNASRQIGRALDWEPDLLALISHFIKPRSVEGLCKHCRHEHTLNQNLAEELANHLGVEANHLFGQTAWHGRGCPLCNHSGKGSNLTVAEVASPRTQPPLQHTEKEWRNWFNNPPHETLEETLVNMALSGDLDIETIQKII